LNCVWYIKLVTLNYSYIFADMDDGWRKNAMHMSLFTTEPMATVYLSIHVSIDLK